jgi:hypothetical protein
MPGPMARWSDVASTGDLDLAESRTHTGESFECTARRSMPTCDVFRRGDFLAERLRLAVVDERNV